MVYKTQLVRDLLSPHDLSLSLTLPPQDSVTEEQPVGPGLFPTSTLPETAKVLSGRPWGYAVWAFHLSEL